MIAFPLFANVAQRIFGAALVILVQDDEIREIDHIDFFELTGRAIVACHYIDREINEIDYFAVALSDTGCLDNDEIEAQRLQEQYVITQHFARREVLPPGSNRTHVNAIGTQRIHANSITEKRAARTTSGWVHSQDGNSHIRETRQKTIQNFVGNAAFAGASGTGYADNGRLPGFDLPLLTHLQKCGFVKQPFLDSRYRGRDIDCRISLNFFGRVGMTPPRDGSRDEVLDHRLKAELHTVVRVVNTLYPVVHQAADFFGRNRAATTTEYFYVARIELTQAIDHVTEEFVVAALVRTNGNTVRIFLNCGTDDVIHTAIVAEVHNLDALRLDKAPHDIDGGIMAVKQRGGRDETQWDFFGVARYAGKIAGNGAH